MNVGRGTRRNDREAMRSGGGRTRAGRRSGFRGIGAATVALLVVMVLPVVAVVVTPRLSGADLTTNNNDLLRTGWYPDESALSPQVVQGGSFGQFVQRHTERGGAGPAPRS